MNSAMRVRMGHSVLGGAAGKSFPRQRTPQAPHSRQCCPSLAQTVWQCLHPSAFRRKSSLAASGSQGELEDIMSLLQARGLS